jgi:hypothetical protein
MFPFEGEDPKSDAWKQRRVSLFSPKIRRHLGVELPNPLFFEGLEFEPRPSTKYRSNFDIRNLIQRAQIELAESEPEQFKVFLLAVMARPEEKGN